MSFQRFFAWALGLTVLAGLANASVAAAQDRRQERGATVRPADNIGPSLTGISPSSATVGGSTFQLTANGTFFETGAAIQWNGSSLPTTLVSSVQLTAQVPASLIASTGSAAITVFSNSYESNPLSFTISLGAAPPSIGSLNPFTATAGGAQFILTVGGSGFVAASTVQWNGSALPTTYVNATQLTAAVAASLIGNAGTATVTVANPAGAISAGMPFPIDSCVNSATNIDEFSPVSIAAGGPAFTLAVAIITQPAFYKTAVVEWNGTPLSTTFNGDDLLEAVVPASLIATPGAATITVSSNAACPDGGTTNAVTFSIVATTLISGVSPTSASAGGPAFTLTVNGSGFVSGSTVEWNGSALATTFVSATRLTASVAANLIASPGTANLTVQISGGQTLGPFPFKINSTAPVISILIPGGTPAGVPGFTLTVNGSGFLPGDSVLWNGSALSTTYVNPTQLTAPLSTALLAIGGANSVTVQSPSGSSNPVTFGIGPVMSSMSPTTANAGGPAFTLTVNGAGFAAGAVVDWNGSDLTPTILSSTQLTASVPASLISSPGTVAVYVANPGRYNSTALNFTITGTPAPLITSATTTAIAGGPAFTISVVGNNFVSGDAVLWNGSALTTTFINANQLSAAVPANLIASAGTATLVVQDPSGRNSNSSTINIVPPTVGFGSLAPASIYAGWPAFTVTCSGANFLSGATLQWNGSALPTTFVNSGTLTASVPAALIARPGAATVTVMNPGGATSTAIAFTIATPSIVSLSPPSTTAGGPAFSLSVSGMGLAAGAAVQWNGSPLSTAWASAAQLNATVTAGLTASPAAANVTVAQGGFTTNSLAFTIGPATPVISGLYPTSVTAGLPSFLLEVSGSGFLPNSTVLWNGAALATVYFNSLAGNSLEATVPASLIAGPGVANVTVLNPGGTSSAAVTFTIGGATPVISGISPVSATVGGPAFTLTVNGSGYLPGAAVRWNGSPLTTNYVSGSQLTVSVPASLVANQGNPTIVVANPSGAMSSPYPFAIDAALPTISSLSPDSATAGGPQFTITVNGSGFLSSSAVHWNGSPLPTIYVSSTQLTAVVSPGLIMNSGGVSLTVANPGAVSTAATFTVNAPQSIISSLSPSSATAGGPAFTLIVYGSGFLPGSVVDWGATGISATYVNAGQLTVSIPAGFIDYPGSINVQVSGASPISNPVVFTINAPGSTPLAITTASPLPAGTVGVPYSQMLAGAGGVAPYKSWTVVDSNDFPPGMSLSVGGSQTAQLAGTPTTGGAFAFTIQVTEAAGSTAAKPFSLTIAGGAISISAAGIVNAASYLGGVVSPGEIITIFGSGFGPGTLTGLQLDSLGYVSSSLANTQVFFDGKAAPMIYAVAGQVSAVVPYEVSGKATTQVHVTYQGQNSNIVSVPVLTTMPGIFTADALGSGPAAIVNQDGTVNSAANPAPVGSYVSVYATGEGQTSPGGVDGMPGGSPAPAPVAQPVTATIGGVAATVQYAGGVPGLISGFLQINLQIPQEAPTGSSVPIVINVGGQSSQANVTLAVR